VSAIAIWPLAADAVHLWTASLDPGAWPFGVDVALSVEEQERADRFLDRAARERFVAGRLLARLVLAGYLAAPLATIGFALSPRGKPRLAAPHDASSLHFNLSHAGDVVLLAVARTEIGVDVEAVKPGRFTDSLIKRVFCAGEQALIRASDQPQLQCFQLWVRKESCIKATGAGLISDLASVDVSAGDAVAPTADGQPCAIRCHDLSLGPGYAAAVAALAAIDLKVVIRSLDRR
jgi:4'-phosphopantetheinyl transferase